MKKLIVGTIGHIDHGITTLTQILKNTDNHDIIVVDSINEPKPLKISKPLELKSVIEEDFHIKPKNKKQYWSKDKLKTK